MILNNKMKREANDNKFINLAFFTLNPSQNSCYTSACYYCICLHFFFCLHFNYKARVRKYPRTS